MHPEQAMNIDLIAAFNQFFELVHANTDTAVRARLGEISRFAVFKVFQRRIGELGTLAGVADKVEIHFENDKRRGLPHISPTSEEALPSNKKVARSGWDRISNYGELLQEAA